MCATARHTSSPVGSVTIAASAVQPRTSACAPMLANSSSHTADTITSPARGDRAASAPAHMIAARPAFMS